MNVIFGGKHISIYGESSWQKFTIIHTMPGSITKIYGICTACDVTCLRKWKREKNTHSKLYLDISRVLKDFYGFLKKCEPGRWCLNMRAPSQPEHLTKENGSTENEEKLHRKLCQRMLIQYSFHQSCSHLSSLPFIICC